MTSARDPDHQRKRMVEAQLRARGIADERVLAAMGRIPRERFLPPSARGKAYRDGALGIGCDQTISQPWILAAICAALKLDGGERLLEIGAGSGYSAAVLASLAATVISVERVPELAAAARLNLDRAGFAAVELEVGDGSLGLPDRAPFEAIAVHAAVPGPPRALLAQLSPGGRLVAPVRDRDRDREMLTCFTHRPAGEPSWETRDIGPCRFVPLIGAEGFDRDPRHGIAG